MSLGHFSARARKNKKNPLRENSYIPGKMELSNSNINFFFIFSQKKAVLIFQETELSYISRKGYSEPWHNETFHIFQERYI